MRTPTIDGGMTGRCKLGAPEAPALAFIAQTGIHAFASAFVFNFVTRLGLWVSFAVLPALAAGQDLGGILKAVESRYNRAQTLEVQFQQTFSVPNRGQRTESGALFLRKPGRMRWQYASPPGKLFLSDGKFIYLYLPSDNRVEKTRVKESEDLRAPLAFLLGKLDFQKDFKKFTARPEGPDTWIVAEPRSDNLAYTQVAFLVTPAFEIRRLEVTGQDRSVMEFRFAGKS